MSVDAVFAGWIDAGSGVGEIDYDAPLVLDNPTLKLVAETIRSGRRADNGFIEHLCCFAGFNILRERDDLCDMLIRFLVSDLLVVHLRKKIADWRRWGRNVLWPRRYKRLNERLAATERERERLWRDYEIFRRFIDYDNTSIKVAMS